MTRALLLPTDGIPREVTLPKGDTHKTVSNLVAQDGLFDVVHDRERRVRGYLHDSGLLLGLPVNPVASLLFGMNLVGDILLTNPLNPQGEFDGYDYDLDDRWFSAPTLLALQKVGTDQEIVKVLEENVKTMDLGHHMYSLTDEQMTEYIATGAIPENARRVSD